MKFRVKKIALKRNWRMVLIISVLVLVFLFLLYQHNIFYASSFQTGSLSESKDIQIGYRGGYLMITVRMVNSSGAPIINEEVDFLDLMHNVSIGGVYTNFSGYAVLNWGIPRNYSLGIVTIQATCPNRSDAIPVLTDLLIKANTTFGNLSYPVSVYQGGYLMVEANLWDNNNISISDQRVLLYDYQNNSLNESITDSLGYCKLFWGIPPSTAPGQYRFKLKFEGTELYCLTESEFNVTIISRSFEILSITLNATRVKTNTPILVNVELNYSDPFVSVLVNDFLLGKAEGNAWSGIINASSIPGKYPLNVIVFYNGTLRINASSTYYIVEGDALDLSAVAFLPFLSEDDSLSSEIAFFAPLSVLSIVSAVIVWRKKKRQPSFSKDYTLNIGSNL